HRVHGQGRRPEQSGGAEPSVAGVLDDEHRQQHGQEPAEAHEQAEGDLPGPGAVHAPRLGRCRSERIRLRSRRASPWGWTAPRGSTPGPRAGQSRFTSATKVTVPRPTLSRVRRPPSRWAAMVTPVAIAAGSSRLVSASIEERRVDTARIARIPAGIHSAIAVTRRESRSGCRITKGRARSAKVIPKPIAMTARRYPVSGTGALPPPAQQVADH